ncbi:MULTISPECIES: FKBP-type peptidyl-prolyl cis-trans isomerase [Acinetobacter calcoaceticus/baumannii complex]|uniref:FKBP-type peptidyl-prolyl cis-trans isomerase n=1 Tax=Acinetobacter calcoaceticus/baumannii complex TaxID=909768 RepID=UPI00044E91DB|nr:MULTISPECIES: FKBP-type peptidyl-prolyl cis-trans isomerase [Acinetobacter calcoaceticus/baumannii complex]EXB67471.1 FKBP-type peptidyl-prolyl cis-trans isomerase family protein [Acinetobacter sp. 21871]EXR60958.1 FKBP-type peptidyl-prolyl cis-trans isomerase family protein [Acinetobacter sp. 1424608]MBJ9725735.1 FKBP-type peptidyl-prolyl cis-trans isomerase [Acinetobacter nosocomialis]HEM7794503.1 FKBP-type peptidyl-prolyl cis-trans isomerase [Acinetobacter nosocomialis]
MKKISLVIAASTMSLSVIAATPVTNKSPAKDQFSYSYGYLMGRNNTDALTDLNLDIFYQGLQEGAQKKTARLTDEEMAKAINEYKKTLEAKQLVEFQKLGQQNAQAGAAFLAENAKKSGVITTKSGLQYQVLKEGSGKTPKATSRVKVNYEGRLLDGTVFDSSIARNHPVDFQLNQVIAGWKEGLQTMKEGGKTRFFIPAKLAYGEVGAGDSIGPNSTLIFDIELLQVLPK